MFFVFPAEVRSVTITNPVTGARGVEILSKHQAAGFLQPELLLELKGRHLSDGFKVLVKAGHAHADFISQALYPD